MKRMKRCEWKATREVDASEMENEEKDTNGIINDEIIAA